MTDPKIIIPVGDPIETVIVSTGEETPQAKMAREAAELAEREEATAQKLIDDAKPKPGEPGYVEPVVIPIVPTDEIQTIEITGEDNVVSTFNLDKDGNAIDDKGTIVYTAAKLLELGADQPADEDQFTAISTLSGIKLLNPDGTPKTYENTVEGFAKREIDVKTLAIQEGANLGVKNFLESNPELADMYEYKRMYGSLDNYTSFVDYSKMVIDPVKKDINIDLIYKAEIQKGTSPDRAKRIANFSVADDTLVADATEALEFLKTAQVSKVTERATRENTALLKEIEQENMYFGVAYDDKGKEIVLNVKDSIYDIVVNEGKVGNIVIPKEGLIVKQTDGSAKNFTRKQIFDYISLPVKEINGEYVTQAQLDEHKRLTDKTQVIGTYIRNLLGGDISQLVEAAKLKDKATTVRKLVIKSGSSVNKGSEGTKGKPIIVVK
jgi:hypothetical protein